MRPTSTLYVLVRHPWNDNKTAIRLCVSGLNVKSTKTLDNFLKVNREYQLTEQELNDNNVLNSNYFYLVVVEVGGEHWSAFKQINKKRRKENFHCHFISR